MSSVRPALLMASVAFALGACARGPKPIEPAATIPVQITIDRPLTCAEVTARVIANPLLEVDLVPSPIAYNPPALKYPVPSFVARTKRPNVSIEVLIDTLGRANMKTFKVVRTSHKYYSDHLREAVSQWRFAPALIGPCKVPGIYRFAMSGDVPEAPRSKKP